MPDQPTSTHGNYPGTASNCIWAYRPNGRQCRRKADLDFLTFCVLEETTGTTVDDLDEDGAERPRPQRAVMDRRSRPGLEPSTLEAVGDQWHYALVVVQAGEEEEEKETKAKSGCKIIHHTINYMIKYLLMLLLLLLLLQFQSSVPLVPSFI